MVQQGICRICKKAVPPRSKGEAVRLGGLYAPVHSRCLRTKKSQRTDRARELYDQGWTLDAIAKELKVHRSTIWMDLQLMHKKQITAQDRVAARGQYESTLVAFWLSQRLPTGYLAELADGWLPAWART
jgi:hypothetical protein